MTSIAHRTMDPGVLPHRSTNGSTASTNSSGRAVVVCDQWLGSNGYAALKALRRAGWACEVVAEWDYVPVHWTSTSGRLLSRAIRPFAVASYNAALRATAARIQPEFLLVFKGTFVQRESINAIRRGGVRTYCFFPDVSFRTHGKYLPRALPGYDWVFTTKSFGIRDLEDQLGVRTASVLSHAFDTDLHRPVAPSTQDHERYDCDVSFIGTWSPKKEAILTALRQRRPEVRVRIFGNQWSNVASTSPLRDAIAGYAVSGDEYVRAIACSSINLGLLSERRRGASGDDQITSRSFHIPASGGFLLHERTREVLSVFEENASIACFDGADELIAKVDAHLLNLDERQRIAQAGRQVVEAAHSWDHRIQDILALHERARS